MDKILRYLDNVQPDSCGEAWVLVSRIMADLGLTREKVYVELMKAHGEGYVKIIKTLEPGPCGLLSVTITDCTCR